MIPRNEIPRAVARLAAPNLRCMLKDLAGSPPELVELCLEDAMTQFIEDALELAEKAAFERRTKASPN